MSQKKMISCSDITLLYELAKEIRKYQGVRAQSLFGIEENFVELIVVDSLNITKKSNWILITGKTPDYNFEIHKFGNITKIERCSKDRDVNIIRFVDGDSNVRTNCTITYYKPNNNPLSKTRSISGKGNATLLCDCDGNFISEEQFWQIYEDKYGGPSFKPYVRHEFLQAIDNGFVLGKEHKYYYEETMQPNRIMCRKYAVRNVSGDKKSLELCTELSERTYYALLEEFFSMSKEENIRPKQKLINRIFKHKA